MGVFDKFLDIMKLNDDEYDDDDFYDDDFEDDDFDEKPHRSIFGNKKSRSDDFDDFDMDEDSQKRCEYGGLCCKTDFCR